MKNPNDKKTFIFPITELKTRCSCGGRLRIHRHDFNRGETDAEGRPVPTPNYYMDCAGSCRRVSGWKESVAEAAREFETA